MKPNDKALDEALSVTQIPEENMREYMRRVLIAAFAAQFQSEDYAGLVKELREDVLQFNLKDTAYENIAKDAADALEALRAERDALKAELAAVTEERDRLREALKPFAAEFSLYKTDFPDHFYISDLGFTFGQLRAAAAALEGVTEPSAGENNGK